MQVQCGKHTWGKVKGCFLPLFTGRVVSVIALVLNAFYVTFVCSSESICMSRFSGIYRIVSNSFPVLV